MRETSRRRFWNRGGPALKSVEEVRRDFSDVVLPASLQSHVRALAAVTSNTKAHGAPFRHMLFYGESLARWSWFFAETAGNEMRRGDLVGDFDIIRVKCT